MKVRRMCSLNLGSMVHSAKDFEQNIQNCAKENDSYSTKNVFYT